MSSQPTFVRRRNDTGPDLDLTLLQPDETPFDPTGYTLQLQLQSEDLDPDEDAWIAGGGIFVVVDAAAGNVRYQLVAADTVTAGRYRLLVEAYDGVSDRQSFPQRNFARLIVTPQNLDQ